MTVLGGLGMAHSEWEMSVQHSIECSTEKLFTTGKKQFQIVGGKRFNHMQELQVLQVCDVTAKQAVMTALRRTRA